jgi:hypothetical protein
MKIRKDMKILKMEKMREKERKRTKIGLLALRVVGRWMFHIHFKRRKPGSNHGGCGSSKLLGTQAALLLANVLKTFITNTSLMQSCVLENEKSNCSASINIWGCSPSWSPQKSEFSKQRLQTYTTVKSLKTRNLIFFKVLLHLFAVLNFQNVFTFSRQGAWNLWT